jgi:CheY-like chemotaxis protein
MSTVLVIEDDHDTRVALREMLEAEGFTVLSAANGLDGYNVLRQTQSPVVVVLDQNMPVASGEDFLKQKRGDQRLRNVPVIVTSAQENRVSYLGVNAYLQKPYEFSCLVDSIRKLGPAHYWDFSTAAG